MRHADKNRDPEAARKRAKSDARCALRKLELLDRIEQWEDTGGNAADGEARAILYALQEELGCERDPS